MAKNDERKPEDQANAEAAAKEAEAAEKGRLEAEAKAKADAEAKAAEEAKAKAEALKAAEAAKNTKGLVKMHKDGKHILMLIVRVISRVRIACFGNDMPLDGTTFDLLTVADVAAVLHCSKAHICNLAAGRVHGCAALPALRLGRRMLVRRQSLLTWIENNDKIASSPERGRKTA